MIVLYHGSSQIVEHPQFGRGRIHNDYGQGFYCTEVQELAMEWACGENSDGYCNQYEVDESGLSILYLDSGRYSILHWITMLIENRTFDISSEIADASKRFLIDNYHIDLEGFDCIAGYRADDSYFRYAQDFISGTLSIERLSQAIRLGDLGKQFMVRSPCAFDALRFKGYTICEADRFYRTRRSREDEARAAYRLIRSQPFDPEEITMLDLLRGTVSKDDPRLS